MAPSTIAVIGSLNVDFITRTPRMPAAGETLTANSFETGFGGKGANQAVACIRLADEDTKVSMVGNVGDDSFGAEYVDLLAAERIDASLAKKVKDQKTGIANIIVEENSGENRIMLAPNANHYFAEQRDAGWEMVPDAADTIVFQLEIPLPVVLHNIHEAHQKGKYVILNPAPALSLPESTFKEVDTLIMNETEARLLSAGLVSPSQAEVPLDQLPKRFLQFGIRDAVIVTLGERGLLYATKEGKSGTLSANKVKVIDTTAAGDTFLGAYAVRRAGLKHASFDIVEALTFANLAAGKTVEKKGAMASIPFRREFN